MGWEFYNRGKHEARSQKQYALGSFEEADFNAWLLEKKEIAPAYVFKKVIATLSCYSCKKSYRGNQRRGKMPICHECRRKRLTRGD